MASGAADTAFRIFDLSVLAAELSRVDRSSKVLLGLIALSFGSLGVGGAWLVVRILRAGTTSSANLAGPLILMVAPPLVAGYAFLLWREYASAPTVMKVGEHDLRLLWPDGRSRDIRWADWGEPVTVEDVRGFGPTWRDGAPRHVDFVIALRRPALRVPVSLEGMALIVRSSLRSGLSVEGWSEAPPPHGQDHQFRISSR